MSATDPIRGEIRAFAFGFAPKGWLPCEGQYLNINGNQALFALIGLTYGGDGSRFRLPDLRGKALINSNGKEYKIGNAGGEEKHTLTVAELPSHHHAAIASSNNRDVNTPLDAFWAADKAYNKASTTKLNAAAMGKTGGDQGHDNMAPFTSLNYCIAVEGIYPSHEFSDSEEYVGCIKAYALPTAVPYTAIPCDGREVSITANLQLFSVIKTTYGGNGQTTFKVPDLRGRAGVHFGQGDGLTHYDLGETAGVTEVTLNAEQLPAHQHKPKAKLGSNTPNPSDTMTWANGQGRPAPNGFAKDKGKGQTMNPGALSDAGEGKAHNNMMPYLVMNYYITATGVFPPRD